MIYTLDLLSDKWLELMWRITWQGGVFIAVIFLITKVFRKASPTVRHLLWMLVIVKFLIMPFVIVPVTVPSLPTIVHKPIAEPVIETPVLPLEPEIVSELDAALPAEGLLTTTEADRLRAIIDWPSMLFSLWLFGVLTLLLGIVYRSLRLKRDISTAKVLEDSATLQVIEEGSRELRVKQPLLKVSDKLRSPLACGILHPTLVFPEHIIEKFSQSELKAIINHELAHIKRMDILTNWFQILAQVFYFFNPLLWYANRQIRLEREQACDDWVLQVGKEDGKRYADALVKVVKLCSGGKGFALGIVGVSEPFTLMARRLKMIMDSGRKISTKISVTGVVGLLLFVLLATPAYTRKGVRPAATPSRAEKYEKVEATQPARICSLIEELGQDHGIAVTRVKAWLEHDVPRFYIEGRVKDDKKLLSFYKALADRAVLDVGMRYEQSSDDPAEFRFVFEMWPYKSGREEKTELARKELVPQLIQLLGELAPKYEVTIKEIGAGMRSAYITIGGQAQDREGLLAFCRELDLQSGPLTTQIEYEAVSADRPYFEFSLKIGTQEKLSPSHFYSCLIKGEEKFRTRDLEGALEEWKKLPTAKVHSDSMRKLVGELEVLFEYLLKGDYDGVRSIRWEVRHMGMDIPTDIKNAMDHMEASVKATRRIDEASFEEPTALYDVVTWVCNESDLLYGSGDFDVELQSKKVTVAPPLKNTSAIEVLETAFAGSGFDFRLFGTGRLHIERLEASLGIRVGDASSEMLEKHGLPNQKALLVIGVVPRSPADKADLEKGDIILKVDGAEPRNIGSPSRKMSFNQLYRDMHIGDAVELTVIRDGKAQTMKVRVGAYSSAKREYVKQ